VFEMKRFTLIFAAAALAVMFSACDAVPLYEDSYYPVYMVRARGTALSSAEDLAKIGVDEDYPLDGSYYLAADIDMSAHGGWTPIGTLEAPFSGVLDGDGKTISGFSLKGGGAAYTGLFGYCLSARLLNLTIEVENTPVILVSTATTGQYAGILAGFAKSSSMNGITVRGAADGQLYLVKTGSATSFWAGGLAGYLEDCAVSGITVSLSLNVMGSSQLRTGLIAGDSNRSMIKSCSVEGSLDAATGAGIVDAGGIVGYNVTGNIQNCVSAVTRIYATTEVANANAVNVGGIAGRCQTATTISSCRLEAGHPVTIHGKSLITNGTVYAGGICGYFTGSSIDRCLVEADIIAEAGVFAHLSAGGIAGYTSAPISNSFVRGGEVLAKAPYSAAVTTTAYSVLAGGIAGTNNGGTSGSPCTITNCFSSANVTAESALRSNVAIGNGNVTAAGGIVGRNFGSYGYTEYCAASGTVRAVSSNSEANANTTAFAGGIVGYFAINGSISIDWSAALGDSVTAEAALTQSYAYRVLGGIFNSSTIIAGTLAGANLVSLANNYGLPDMEVRTKQGGADWTDIPQQPNNTANVTGSGNMELTQTFFETRLGWDFDMNWNWDAETNLPVPRYN
jgi:hypothetical protein